VLCCAFSLAYAADSRIEIKQAELTPLEEFYSLDAEIEMELDEAIIEAVNKGVPLDFIIEFQIVNPRKYWFDDEIVTKSTSVTLSYHALTKQYLVNRGKHQKSFETLQEAKDELVQLSNWKVLDRAMLEKKTQYKAALLIRLDQSKLPKAIQVDAIGSEKWNLTSQKYEWFVKEPPTQ
jgi:hypothetical protein